MKTAHAILFTYVIMITGVMVYQLAMSPIIVGISVAPMIVALIMAWRE